MAIKLIDYLFKDPNAANPDGTFPMKVTGATVTNGPGTIPAGNFPKALDLGTAGKGAVDIATLAIDLERFAVRVVFQANGSISDRQNLAESDLLPFSLFIAPRTGTTDFDLVASVAPKAHGWRSATTRLVAALKPGVWYTADLVYDLDTVGLFVDGTLVAVRAFPEGKIEKGAGTRLFLGTWVDGARNHFAGKVAALQCTAGIPDELLPQLDESRVHPEWFITHKQELVRPTVNLGEATAAIAYDSAIDAYTQPFERGLMMYHDGAGVAFEMHGAIRALYQTLANRADLGFLVCDEAATTKAGGRKSVFARGAIYWSGTTGAVPVLDQIYLDYEALGESRALGFPVRPARPVTGGLEQEFQGARMYHRDGAAWAREVHGGILEKFLALGGTTNWGFPLSHEGDVMKDGHPIGRVSEFEGCTIFWSTATGAFETHGDIRARYRSMGGPAGDLGFPISDEADIPGVAGPARYNRFQNGSLLWYGSAASIVVARPFRIFIGRINTKESEGLFMGQNDVYTYVKVKDGDTTVYDKRHPASGDSDGNNILDLNLNIPVVFNPDPGKTVTLIVDVWEADPGNDDHLGKWVKELSAANAWGMLENGGILNSGSFGDINSITASIKPAVDIATLSEVEKFWGVENRGTDDLSYPQYASAFSNVDSETEWWDVTDWLDKAFYELVVKDIAENGNCFGMSLEAINARKDRSLFSVPLNRFTNWDPVRPEVNVKHAYQVGAGPIWWFVKEFITGNTHDPKDVFNRTRDHYAGGNNPVLCISQDYDFGGAPHCVMPVGWDDGSRPWKMAICDPNFPNELKTLTVDPDENTYEYVGKSTYRGGEWSGGRMHFMPYSLVNSRPRTPIWDAILLLLAGTVVILGDDARTVSITDADGKDLDAYGDRAKGDLKAGQPLNDYFVTCMGYNRRVAPTVIDAATAARIVAATRTRGAIAGEFMVRTRVRGGGSGGPAVMPPRAVVHLPIAALSGNRRMRGLREALGEATMDASLARRSVLHLASDATAMGRLTETARGVVRAAAAAAQQGDFRHQVAGRRSGTFRYALKHGLAQFKVEAPLAEGERTDMAMDRIGTSKATLRVKTDRDKQVRLEIDHQLGVARDRIHLAISGIPAETGKEVQLNLKPGLSGLEMMAGPSRAGAEVEVRARIGDKEYRGRFGVALEGGVRLNLSTILSQNVLGVSRIDHLFGPARSSSVIRSR